MSCIWKPDQLFLKGLLDVVPADHSAHCYCLKRRHPCFWDYPAYPQFLTVWEQTRKTFQNTSSTKRQRLLTSTQMMRLLRTRFSWWTLLFSSTESWVFLYWEMRSDIGYAQSCLYLRPITTARLRTRARMVVIMSQTTRMLPTYKPVELIWYKMGSILELLKLEQMKPGKV